MIHKCPKNYLPNIRPKIDTGQKRNEELDFGKVNANYHSYKYTILEKRNLLG